MAAVLRSRDSEAFFQQPVSYFLICMEKQCIRRVPSSPLRTALPPTACKGTAFPRLLASHFFPTPKLEERKGKNALLTIRLSIREREDLSAS